MKKNFLNTVVFAVALLLGQSVFAHDCGEKLKEMVQTLKLDATQQEKIKGIKEQLKANMKSDIDQFKGLRDQINQQVQSDNMDNAKVDELINTKAQLVGKVIKAKVAAEHEIYMVLNAQQKTQFQALKKKWEDKMAKKYEKCHDDHDD